MRDVLPAGYTFLLVEGGVRLALPQAVAAKAEAESRAKRQLEVALHNAPSKPTQGSAAGKSASASAKRKATKALRKGPAPGFHRALPRYAELVAQEGDDEALRRASSDDDVRRRRQLLHERLLKLGPDRRIARPEAWQEAVDALEQAMPNFREPIRLLRNTLAMAAATSVGVRVPPMLLLGPPGVGKTYFSQRVAELLGAPHAALAFDQALANSGLLGSDKFWGNTEAGLLFNLLCLGEVANPMVLLDELDKSTAGGNRRELDPLAQLHAVLEPQTARCLQDISTDIEFDASLVGYVATANTLHGIGVPLLSRFEIFEIGPPGIDDSIEIARQVAQATLERLGLQGRVQFARRCAYVLARLSPRLMRRTVERLAAAALHDGRVEVTEAHLWNELGMSATPRLH